MRILHTSDWHLGLISGGSTSRGPEHDLFLAWLTAQIAAREVDTLVVAGDVFDSMQPSAEAQARYYRFLGGLGGSGLRQVVIVGGNHDSASRLDAPREVLSALHIHVVGGLGDLADPAARYLVPLEGRSGAVEAVCLAVPYVNEFRLGVRGTDPDHAAVRREFIERFGALYTRLTDEALVSWPGLPLVATGHLTLGPATRDDYLQQIHCVGLIESLPDSVLDPRLQYVALGHIHRPYPVAGGRAWYAGSPVALTLPEAGTGRRVLCVDLDPDPAGRATITPIEVPVFRGQRLLEGSPEEILAQARALAWAEPLAPLVHVLARTDLPDPLFGQKVAEVVPTGADGQRPLVADVRLLREVDPGVEEAVSTADLQELGPAEVFRALCRARGVSEHLALEEAFAFLHAARGEKPADLFTQMTGDLS
ncbi:MAG: exonuclease subunit SbcD [Pseudomonadota bacterium]